MGELLAIFYSFIAVGIFSAAIAGLCVQGQAMIVPEWRLDHWNIFKSSTEQHWFTSKVKFSAQELEAIQGAYTRWESQRNQPLTTLNERCVMAVACRGLKTSEDRVHRLERCATALHRRALRKSADSVKNVLPRVNSIRRWEWKVYREIWKAWIFGVHSGFRDTCQNVLKNLTALMGLWATIALILAMPSWLIVGARAEVDFIDFIGKSTAWGGVIGSIHGLGRIWYDVTKSAGVQKFSKSSFWFRVIMVSISCIAFTGIYKYIGSLKTQSSISAWLEVKAPQGGWIFGPLLLAGFLLWTIYIMWTWVRSPEVVASDRVRAGMSICLYGAMTIIFALYLLQSGKVIPEKSAFEYIQGVSVTLVLVLFIGTVIVMLLMSVEHIRRTHDLRDRGVEVKVRGYSLKYLTSAILGVFLSFTILLFVEELPVAWTNQLQGFILILSLVAIFMFFFVIVIFEGAMLAVKFKRVSLRYRRISD